MFDGATTHTISVDARYMLWVDAIDTADHLITEMGLTPAINGRGELLALFAVEPLEGDAARPAAPAAGVAQRSQRTSMPALTLAPLRGFR